jgi:RNA polymerase sigma-70 factor (ECF subfamily)
MADETLVRAAARGDKDAFARLVAPRLDRLFATASLILRHRARAEDALQDALVRAWRDLPTLRDPARLDAWLRRLLVHACYDDARRNRRHAANLTLLPEHDRGIPDGTVELSERDAVEGALQALSVDHRAAVVLHYYLGLSLPEIADALGIPVGTAKSRLHHARNRLRATLGATPSEGQVA